MSDDVRSKREPQLTEYRPTLKERIANTFMGDSRPSPERRQFAQGLADLAYYTPGVGEAMAGDALGRGIASGDYAAAAKAAAGVIPGTGKAVTSRLPKAFGGQSYASEMMAVGAKGGGRINTTIDRDPDWDMGLAEGGEVENALRIAERAKGGGAWTRKEGQNPEGGLNAKGRAAAKAEGHNLKPPAPNPKTEKDAARRKSFCARMSGMKKRLTSAETARDPDSRINKSLRAWNCHADGGEVWDKPRPKHIGKPKKLSDTERASAKAAAKKAGRPYPNLVDNMRAARADGGEVEDALRIAQRPMKPVRFHQTLARTGYAEGGEPEVEEVVETPLEEVVETPVEAVSETPAEEAPEEAEETPKYERLTHPDGYYSRAHEVANGLPEGSLNWARMRRIMLEHPELLEEEMEASGLHSDAFDDEHELTKADIARIIEEHFPKHEEAQAIDEGDNVASDEGPDALPVA
jgi:hypothetical protein